MLYRPRLSWIISHAGLGLSNLSFTFLCTSYLLVSSYLESWTANQTDLSHHLQLESFLSGQQMNTSRNIQFWLGQTTLQTSSDSCPLASCVMWCVLVNIPVIQSDVYKAVTNFQEEEQEELIVQVDASEFHHTSRLFNLAFLRLGYREILHHDTEWWRVALHRTPTSLQCHFNFLTCKANLIQNLNPETRKPQPSRRTDLMSS